MLFISGKHYNKSSNGHESSEFERRYTIPDNIDVISNITPAGILCVEGLRATTTNVDTANASDVEVSEDFYQISLDVNGYLPDEISVRVNGRDLIIHGERKDEHDHEHGSSTHHQQFTRNFNLPDDVDSNALSSRYSNDRIIVAAPRVPAQPKMRQIEIIEE